MQDPKFMEKGGFLGYHCQHLYPISQEDPEVSVSCLKGRDAAFMATIQLLGLFAETYAVWNTNMGTIKPYYGYYGEEDDDEGGFGYRRNSKNSAIWKKAKKAGFVLSKTWYAEADEYMCVGEDATCQDALEEANVFDTEAQDIEWINERSENLRKSLTLASYGNQPAHDAFYHTAAIVVEIPASSERQHVVQLISQA